MQYIEMMHGGEARAARVRVDAEHVEVVPAPVRAHYQHAARVELHRYYSLRVRNKVSHYRIILLLLVLTVFLVQTLTIYTH